MCITVRRASVMITTATLSSRKTLRFVALFTVHIQAFCHVRPSACLVDIRAAFQTAAKTPDVLYYATNRHNRHGVKGSFRTFADETVPRSAMHYDTPITPLTPSLWYSTKNQMALRHSLRVNLSHVYP